MEGHEDIFNVSALFAIKKIMCYFSSWPGDLESGN